MATKKLVRRNTCFDIIITREKAPDFFGGNSLPSEPTSALPGSAEKVGVLVERARLGVSLWHPLDAKDSEITFLNRPSAA